MGRKKKTNKVVAQKESLAYNGEIALTITHGNKVIRSLRRKNTGRGPLFQYLMYCLTGTLYPNQAPKYLRVFDSNNVQITSQAIPVTGLPSYEFSNNGASAILTFNLSSTVFTQLTDIKKFRMYSQDNVRLADIENYSAEVELTNAETMTDGSNLIVAWKMTLSNKVGE